MQAPIVPINADRWVACRRTFKFMHFDFTGASFRLQVRNYADDVTGSLINLVTAGAGAEGLHLTYGGSDTIANHIAAGRMTEVPKWLNPTTGEQYEASDVVSLSIISMRITAAHMSALPFSTPKGDEVELAWDLHITPAGGDEDRYVGGPFIVEPGATQ
jgi:hypothetical protein